MNEAKVISGIKNIILQKCKPGIIESAEDRLIEEAPLQIIIAYGGAGERQTVPLSVTMRTPGDDFNLVTGFLFCEGIIGKSADITSIRFLTDENTVLVELSMAIAFDAEKKKRNFTATSSCGYCGKTTADLIDARPHKFTNNDIKVNAGLLYKLPVMLNSVQRLFVATGGVHAVSLFHKNGALIDVYEDVGRHNAMDKLAGAMLTENKIPLKEHIVLFSGRLSYELIQKSVMAGIAIVCAIGAPSSLAIQLAEENDMTVVGFLKNNSFNIYCGAERIEQQ